MKRWLLISFAVLLTTAIATWVVYRDYQQFRLAEYRRTIEAKYVKQFALIEKHSQDFDEEDGEAMQRVRHGLKDALSSRAIYWATWSSDGHHGLMGLKSTGDGIIL